MRRRSRVPTRGGPRVALAALALLAGVASDAGAEVVDPGDVSIYSTAQGGGALATDFAFAPSEVFQSACLGGFCLYSATDPGFITRDEATAGLFPLASGTGVTMEIVSIADEASVLVGSKLLDAAGESASLGVAPGLHLHPTWQVTIPAGGSPAASFPVTFRLTSSGGYAASQTYTLSLFVAGQGPTPGPTPSPSPKPTPTPAATATPTPAPTASPKPSATPGPSAATPSPSPRPSATPSATAKPTATPAPSTKPTATPVPTTKPSSTPVPTPTLVATPSPAPTDDAPPTPRPSAIPSATPSASPRPSVGPTATVPGTATPRPTGTPAATFTPRPSPSPVPTPTAGAPTPVAPGVAAAGSRGDQTLAYFDAREGFTSFVSLANVGDRPLVVRIDLRGRDLRLLRSWLETLDAGATRTVDVGALRAEGVPAEPGLAIATAVDEAGEAIASGALAGNFTVANLGLGSAWGAPAIARRGRVVATGAAASEGMTIDGVDVVLETLRPAAVELATYFAPDTLDRPEAGGNQVIFVSFDDAAAAPEVVPAAMRWVVGGARNDGTPIAVPAVDTSGVEVTHLEELLGADAVGASGRLELIARTPSADNRLVFFAQSLGTFATGYLLPPSR